eukprot:1718595-Pleurochrysis_carterae.AAC.1
MGLSPQTSPVASHLLSLARGDFAAVSHQEGLKLLRLGVFGGDPPNDPQKRRPCEPRCTVRQ